MDLLERKHGWKRCRLAMWSMAVLVMLCSISAHAQSGPGEVSHLKGKDVFEEKGCAQCHSVFGSNGKGGPDLGKRKFYGTYLQLAARMWNHFPKMYRKMQATDVAFQKVDAEEMQQLIAYLAFIRYRGKPGNEYKGQKLLKERCMPCHRFGGLGGDIGPEFDKATDYISSIQFIGSMWNHGPEMMDVFFEHRIRRPVFKGHDIEHILAALRTHISTTHVPVGAFLVGDPALGKELYDRKGCVHCHAYRGEGGTLGPDFDDIDLNHSAVQIAGRMWNHGPEMWDIMMRENLTIPVFEKGEMAHVLAYVYSLKLEDRPGDPDKGRRIIDDKACLDCHTLQGRGATISKDLAKLEGLDSPLAMIAGMWNHAPGMREKQLEKKLKWPKLNARDMADLYAYLYNATHGLDEAE
ncbi:MAG: c-type cytochrome [Candidatus Krumholzibacteria bacterium]|nr:c-type cytochrome [Candidatus Krumholzibacteria bacterium]